jgi:hypothetical protein
MKKDDFTDVSMSVSSSVFTFFCLHVIVAAT